MIVSRNAARNMMLTAQNLLLPNAAKPDKDAVLCTIRKLGALQIDTINIVARAPYHILYSRLGHYTPAWLDELLAEGALFESWAHAACFIPTEDYPFYRRETLEERHLWGSLKKWAQEHPEIVQRVLAHIETNGATKSAAFKNPKEGGTWWNWKDEKMALEYLYNSGRLMIARREKFQRVYDLHSRIMPGWDDRNAPPVEQTWQMQTLKTIHALGVAREDWIAPYFYLPKKPLAGILQQCVQSGQIIPVTIEGWEDKPAYIHADRLDLLQQAEYLTPTLTTILSPFDPLITDRDRARALFNFDYAIECYKPQKDRIYGYFCLPILHQGRLVGRLDAKAHRGKAAELEVFNIYFENDIELTDTVLDDVKSAIQRYAAWQGLQTVVYRAAHPQQALGKLAT